ncbi:methyltransferase domain-containing protein [Spongiimicrobium salis]|uniref:methyltransferase domain-containing protein n=1 Tax=Spongiimicrobium salis TaxID=1667022 RepID=UPI00374DE10B
MLKNLSQRSTEQELMDDPRVDSATLREVLKDINRSNAMLNGNGITLNALEKLIKGHSKDQYTIVDMGCGDGTMLKEIALLLRHKKINARLIGVDLNEKSIAIAQEHTKAFPEISFLQQDILDLQASDLKCDILVCTLTMHHFKDKEIPIFLGQFVKLASIGVIINDLQRSRIAYYLFKCFSLIFIRTKIAKNDGLVSIMSGFFKSELLAFAKQLPKQKHKIKWKWAFRYVWIIQQPSIKQ